MEKMVLMVLVESQVLLVIKVPLDQLE